MHDCSPMYSRLDLVGKLSSTEDYEIDSGKQILQEIAIKLNQKILEPWSQIFPDSPSKNIFIEHSQESDGIALQIKISEGSTSFYVDERSLGFRWFFGFILFTEFRLSRNNEDGEYLFLFDEPANNLHEGSQQKLLELFEEIARKSKILYTTHSPYLLNSKYLLNTFIIKDIGRDGNIGFDYRQNTKADIYKNFVSQNANQETHFKPLLDILDFKVTNFELTDNIVFFEGKNDYYTFKWFINTYLSSDNYNFKLYPGASVNKYENIFREYLAHNKKFIAVFDSDKAGIDAKKNYLKKISQELDKQIFTLKDIDDTFDNITTEFLFLEDEKLKIQQYSFSTDTSYDKNHFNISLQELFIKNKMVELSRETINKIKKVLDFVKSKLEDLENN